MKENMTPTREFSRRSREPVLSSALARDTCQLAPRALSVLSTLSLGYCLAILLGAKVCQAREAQEFDQELRSRVARKPSALTSIAPIVTPAEHGVVGSLHIPRIGISVMVVEGADEADLRRAVGHIPGTALPWDSGNVGLPRSIHECRWAGGYTFTIPTLMSASIGRVETSAVRDAALRLRVALRPRGRGHRPPLVAPFIPLASRSRQGRILR